MQDHEPDSPEQPSLETIADGIERVLHIATTTAQLSAAVGLLMHQRRLLTPPESEHLAVLSRHLGELYEAAEQDDFAGDFAAIASKLRAPPTQQ